MEIIPVVFTVVKIQMLQWTANKNSTNSQYRYIKQRVRAKHFSTLQAIWLKRNCFSIFLFTNIREDLFVLTSTWSEGTSGIPSIISHLSALTNIRFHRMITNKLGNGIPTRTIRSCRLVNKLSSRCVKDCSRVQKEHEVHLLQGGFFSFFWYY